MCFLQGQMDWQQKTIQNNFIPYNPFPRDEILLASRFSVSIFMEDARFQRIKPLQLGITRPRTLNQFTVILFLFCWLGVNFIQTVIYPTYLHNMHLCSLPVYSYNNL